MTTLISTASNNTASFNRSRISQTIWGNASQARPVAVPARTVRAMRHLAQKWDLYGVVTLMASSAAYGAFALAHAA